ncbi:hypothetical protein [Alistipes sp.]|uniref:hypothetical protein n=1 Tax=Alistipes sp. TaxID=1872444 RepID=UPI0023F03632|nr:hypothetical protein [Alistipes sp.]
MKTYRINKYAERLAQGTGFAPELIYNISLVRFQGRNGRCIAAWTPGIKRPRYVYKAHTPEEYDKAMERIRQEAERFRRHDEAQEKAAAAFRESLLRQLDQRTTEDGYMCGTTVPLPDVFKGKTHTHRQQGCKSSSYKIYAQFCTQKSRNYNIFLDSSFRIFLPQQIAILSYK